MNKTNQASQTRPPIDREAIRVLAIELGAREAARRTGVNQNTILSWSRRYKWNLPKRAGGPKAIELQSKPGDVLIAEHQRLEGQTRTGLSKAAASAAEHASEMQGNEVLSHSSQLRNITHVATKVFGWDRKEKPEVQVNQLVISPDAAEALRGIVRDREMSEERRTELYHKIHAGITGRITKEQMAEIRELSRDSLKPGDIGYVAQGEQAPRKSKGFEHQSLRVTPAMEAGITDHVWSLVEMVVS